MLTQQNRIGRLTTPLGPDVLCLVELRAREALSELFDFEIVAASEDANIDLDALIGQPACVFIDADGAGERCYHGLVTEGEWNEKAHDLSYYRLRLQPWCWLLTKTADCRIHHNKTVVQIIEDTFADHGLSAYQNLLTHDYPSLEYTVQYCETDWNFVCRLMEQHGIYYFFTHDGDGHTLVLGDGYSAHKAQGPARPIEFNASEADALLAMRRPYVSRWSLHRKLRSGRFEITDYNHLTPRANQDAVRGNPHDYVNGQFEMFDWPGPHVHRDQGAAYVRFRAEAEEAQDHRRLAQGVAASLYPGIYAALSRHPREAENAEYVVVRMVSHLGPQVYRTDAGSPADGGFEADYEFQPWDLPFRAPFLRHKPRIPSMQTATVVGVAGGDPSEEIDCDDHGRILVHFFWDRHEDRSCRVRVSQVWGGQGWGGQIIPRIGMEVMVAYVDGDPDRPIVVGTVPNPVTLTVPYKLPANKTRMVLKSKTYKRVQGYNELRFEDMTDQEEMFLHAQKDMNTKVLNNKTERIDVNSVISTGANKVEEVEWHSSLVIGMNYVVHVGHASGGFFTNTYEKTNSQGIGDVAKALDPNIAKESGSGNYALTVASSYTISVGRDSSEQIAQNKSIHTGGTLIATSEKKMILASHDERNDAVSKNWLMEGFENITIRCGKSKIEMDKAGNINIEGTSISIKAARINMS